MYILWHVSRVGLNNRDPLCGRGSPLQTTTTIARIRHARKSLESTASSQLALHGVQREAEEAGWVRLYTDVLLTSAYGAEL